MRLYKTKVRDCVNASNLEEKEEIIKQITSYNIIETPDEIDEWVRVQTIQLHKTANELKEKSSRFYEKIKPILMEFINGEGINFKLPHNKRSRNDGRKT